MQKTNANARWNELTADQRKTLDKWLFDEQMGYAAILPRAKSELGFKGEMSSLKRYYARRESERSLETLADLHEAAVVVNGGRVDPVALHTASMTVMGGYVFQQVQRCPEKIKEWAPVAQLMVQNDYNEILRQAKGEERKVQRDKMAFAREKFEFDMIEHALKALPQLLELAEARKDPQSQEFEENRHLNRARRAMFGIGEVHPESAQEEAEMLAAKREREARRKLQTELEQNREKIIDAQPPPPSSPYHQEYAENVKKLEEENRKLCGGAMTNDQ